ncbi:TPA: IS5/IS1182 family transposase, partial [Candidatus Poribacteria bacterium]|nr:IS5/IS1182 family transposase [Candidatus Poribacteria bacterium]
MDKKYPSDMSDKGWEIREVVNAVFYTSRGGCSWPMLPND